MEKKGGWQHVISFRILPPLPVLPLPLSSQSYEQ
jgi:hypothetical protein